MAVTSAQRSLFGSGANHYDQELPVDAGRASGPAKTTAIKSRPGGDHVTVLCEAAPLCPVVAGATGVPCAGSRPGAVADVSRLIGPLISSLGVCPSPVRSLGLHCHVKTRERRGSFLSQLGFEPNQRGLTAQSLFFFEESCRVKRSDIQSFSNYSKRVQRFQKRSPPSLKKTSSVQTHQ